MAIKDASTPLISASRWPWRPTRLCLLLLACACLGRAAAGQSITSERAATVTALSVQHRLWPPSDWGPGRRTDDWQADLITRLIAIGRIETAARISQRHLDQAASLSDQQTRWAIRLSNVRLAMLQNAPAWDPTLLQRASQPVQELLGADAEHPRFWWLQAQWARVDQVASQYCVDQWNLQPESHWLQETALDLAIRSANRLQTTQTHLQQQHGATTSPWRNLWQTLTMQLAQTLLTQSHCFPSGSPDSIAAATSAIGQLRELQSGLVPDSERADETKLLLAEAAIITGRETDALQLLKPLADPAGRPATLRQAVALQVRAHLAAGDLSAAETTLATVYPAGEVVTTGDAGLDLARLAWLIESVLQGNHDRRADGIFQISNWLDAIETTTGRYARRRGEALVFGRLPAAAEAFDARLLAGQAAQLFRAGKPTAAAERFAQAARGSTVAREALRYAQQAAAVWHTERQIIPAVDLLLEIASEHTDAPEAAQLALQAAWLLSNDLRQDSTAEQGTEALRKILQMTAETWPQTEPGRQAADWLGRSLAAAGRYADAAQITLQLARPITREVLEQAIAWWQAALRTSQDDSLLPTVIKELQVAAEETDPQTLAARDAAQLRLLLYFANMDDLRRWSAGAEPIGLDPLDAWLWQVRREGGMTNPPSVPDETDNSFVVRYKDLCQRLVRDGQQHPEQRQRLGKLLIQWLEQSRQLSNGIDEDRLVLWLALAQLWSGQSDVPIASLENYLTRHPGDWTAATEVANVLSQSDQPAAQTKALQLWQRLSQGVPQGSPQWHTAKLAIIDQLIASKRTAEAKRQIRYVLLTQAALSDDQQRGYQQRLEFLHGSP